MTSNQALQMHGYMNSAVFIWIPEIGCKNREDGDGTIPTGVSSPLYVDCLNKKLLENFGKQLPLRILILTGPHR